MTLPKRFNANETEARLLAFWAENGTYAFQKGGDKPIYSIDTPPATVSGHLHLGHIYSYTHADLMARYFRMNGYNVFYPMGFDDNGLPTDRLLEKTLGEAARKLDRREYAQKCLELGEEFGQVYRELWTRLGLSIDWNYTYRTISPTSRQTAQWSFLDLYRKGLIYRQEAPTQWCPECGTGIAQAEVDDLERESEFVTLAFSLEDDDRHSIHHHKGETLEIATTRPELLPACVAIFVHPEDQRNQHLIGQQATVPFFGQGVPILADPAADPEKGTGVVMCCTFGDTTDVTWWQEHNLPLVAAIDRHGRMTDAAGQYAGLPVAVARKQIKADLEAAGLLLNRRTITQTVRVHERCDTPIEHIVTRQWFVKVLDYKEDLLAIGEGMEWHPPHMQARYRSWVENLAWDWCISRQRHFGVPFPVWFCADCGEVVLAEEDQLPIDPTGASPNKACPACGGENFRPETDVMDTWATSSHSPQLAGQWLTDVELYAEVYPFALRPQAHEIIRTWAFYTIVKAYHHGWEPPWKALGISGWGIAAPGQGKISKSRGGGPIPPIEAIETYSADAVRYWAASTGFGKDAIIDEEKMQNGVRLVTKLWNVARFSARFLEGYIPSAGLPDLTPADRWLLARLQELIRRVTQAFEDYEYAAAKSEIENFFWKDLADNYLEMAKQRLYNPEHPQFDGARHTLYHTLLGTLKLFAPFLPFVAEELYLHLFAESDDAASIHTSAWPQVNPTLADEKAISLGFLLVDIATAVRRFKSENNLSLGTEIHRLQLALKDAQLVADLKAASGDLMSVTRCLTIEVGQALESQLTEIPVNDTLRAAIELAPAAEKTRPK